MTLAVWEWRKLFRLPALWVFVGLCLALNGLLLSSTSAMDRSFFNDTSADAAALGQRVDEEFLTGLEALPDTENRTILRQYVTGLENTLEGYDTQELTNFYQSLMAGDSLAQSWMAWKYDLLQERVDHLAQTGAALDLYALLALLTLGPYLLLWDYGGIWDSSVSSQFNYFVDMLYSRPFLTWTDFTVGGYFAAMIAAGGGLAAVFTLMGAVAGLLIRHTYGAAIAAAAFCALLLGLSSALANLGMWSAYLLTTFSPVCLWLAINGWFTELGQSGLVPWQETVGMVLNLLIWVGLVLLALRRFGRKDVA